MFRSLRFRMAASHALVLAVLMLTLGALVQYLLARSLDRAATTQLLEQASGQVELIREAGKVLPPIDADSPSVASVRVAVYGSPDETIVGEPAEVPSWLKRYRAGVTDLTVAGEAVRVVVEPVVVNGTRIAWVATGRSLEPEEQLVHRVRLLFLLGGGTAVLASLGAGWLLAGRAVHPVERSYEAQAGFAADASHELRTPLAFIRTGVEVLAERDPELGGEVLSEVDYLTELSQRLLQLARAERGEHLSAHEPFDLARACRSAAHRSDKAYGNRLRLTGLDGIVVLGDHTGLQAALDVILENVARHGGGEAEVSWTRNDGEAIVSVVDHGGGLSPEHEDRAFERFFRADPSRARGTGGAGLGLTLARSLVVAQDGRMWIEPTPGGGLTANIALPVRRA